MSSSLARVASRVLDWLLPPDCLGCGCELPNPAAWCSDCLSQLARNRVTEFDHGRLVAPYEHRGPIRPAIHRLKYGARADVAARLVRSGFRANPSDLGHEVILVPVPLHPNRLVERGYNQSALLARAIGLRWHMPVLYDLLSRCSDTKPQVGKNRQQRLQNLHGAFVVSPKHSPSGIIWIVDDVVTTGATVASCRAALVSAGLSVGGVIAVSYAEGIEASPSDARSSSVLASWP